MGCNLSYFNGCDNCPVDNVSWDDVQDFIEKLNKVSGEKYRLPTCDERDLAANEGNENPQTIYSGSDNVEILAWYINNCRNKTHEVGGKDPNEKGLFDMSGNVSEWCLDSEVFLNQRCRTYRGGDWNSEPHYYRVRLPSDRMMSPKWHSSTLGFRLFL